MLKERVRSLLPAGGFGRSVTILAGGTAIGQALAILASPVLTRLYGPADFGLLAVYTSIIGIAGSLAALSYHQAIPLPEEDGDAAQVLGVSILSTALVALLVAVGAAVGGARLVVALDAPGLEPYLWMIPLGVLGLASYEVLTQWAVRKKSFPTIARTSVARGAAQTGTQLGLGLLGVGPLGLLGGQLLGQWAGSGSLLRHAARESGPALRRVTPAGMRAAAARWRRFPQFTAPAVLLNVAGMDAPPLLLSFFFGGTVTGLYALGARVLMMPVALVAKSASQVFFASAPGYLREGRLGVEVERLFGRMVRLALAPIAIVAVAAPSLFAVVFGEEWREAGIYVRWLSPLVFFAFVSFTLSPLISVLERQAAAMAFQSALLFGRVTALAIGGVLDDSLWAVALFSAVSVMLWIAYLLWLLLVSGVRRLHSLSSLGEEMLWSLPVLAPMVVVHCLFSNKYLLSGVAAFCGLIYLAILAKRRKTRRPV